MNVSQFTLTFYTFAALLVLTLVLPRRFLGFKILNPFRSLFHKLSSPRASIITVCIFSFALSAGISFYKKPVPRIHDEFSYLLAADTFPHGRMTNPTHPFWKHFESIHIIHQPSYASKYPPGQGLFLALGQVLTGHPIVGVWLSLALACGAICWMLHAWVPPKWAFAGGLLAAMHPQSILWGQNFWGGAVAVLGGALLFGALRRLMNQPRTSTSLLLGLGLFVLAISRPFEGFLIAILAAVLLLIWMVRQTEYSRKILFRTLLLPLGVCSCLIIGAIAFYNYQITGSPTRFAYQIHEATYAPAPLFIWGTPQTPLANNNERLKNFHYGWALSRYMSQQEIPGYLYSVFIKFTRITEPLIVFPLGILLLMLPWIVRNHWGRLAVCIMLFISLTEILGMTFFQLHYLAPLSPLLFFIFIQGLRHWRAARWKDHKQGQFFVLAICLLFVSASFMKMWLYASSQQIPSKYKTGLLREELIERLKTMPKKDLIFVKYPNDFDPHFEWVYNRADIDNAEVVWAHILTNEENQKLIEYFADHQIWWIDADARQLKLRPVKGLPPNQKSETQSDISSAS